MRGVRVVVRHAAHGSVVDLALDGVPIGRLETASERWLTVDPGPHSLFANHGGFPQGVIKAFVAEPGVDVCLWIAPVGLTNRVRFVEQVDEPPPPAVPWSHAVVMAAPATLVLTLLSLAHRVWPSHWAPNAGGATAVALVSVFVTWVRTVAHAWRARLVGLAVLFTVIIGTGWVGHGPVAGTLRLVGAVCAASLAYAAATHDLPFGRRFHRRSGRR